MRKMKKIIKNKIIIKILFCFVLLAPLLLSSLTVQVFASAPRFMDEVGILTEAEASSILATLDETSNRLNFDLVILVTDNLQGRNITDFADRVYHQNNFGIGADDDGAILVVSFEPNNRQFEIVAQGFGYTAFTDSGIQDAFDRIQPFLRDGNYARAFNEFVRISEEYVELARAGTPHGRNVGDRSILFYIAVAVVIGVVVATIITLVMKGKLKSVAYQTGANQYMEGGSVNLTNQRDLFLYRNITRRPRPQNNGGGRGGGGGFRSVGGGMARGGGGRGF